MNDTVDVSRGIILIRQIGPLSLSFKPSVHGEFHNGRTRPQDLGILDSDPRRPYAEIARELDVSQPTVADRMRRLEGRGIVRGAMLCMDHARLGFNISAFRQATDEALS